MMSRNWYEHRRRRRSDTFFSDITLENEWYDLRSHLFIPTTDKITQKMNDQKNEWPQISWKCCFTFFLSVWRIYITPTWILQKPSLKVMKFPGSSLLCGERCDLFTAKFYKNLHFKKLTGGSLLCGERYDLFTAKFLQKTFLKTYRRLTPVWRKLPWLGLSNFGSSSQVNFIFRHLGNHLWSFLTFDIWLTLKTLKSLISLKSL